MDDKKIHDGSFSFSFSGPVVNFNDGEVKRVPPNTRVPTIAELRSVIPKHCFEASALSSSAYVARDLIIVGTLAFSAYMLLDPVMPSISQNPLVFAKWLVGWNIYAFWQGTALLGIWTIAHECSHGAFSSSPVLNDIVGFFLHTSLLVPYFSFQFSHKKHHSRLGHIVDGEGQPISASDFGLLPSGKYVRIAALADAHGSQWFSIRSVVHNLLLGWPNYLLKHASGRRRMADGSFKTSEDAVDHFRPSSKIFPQRMRTKVAVSTAGIIAFLGLLIWASIVHGVWAVANFYFAPYLWHNAWLITYTWLHHTHFDLPHYGEDAWNWVRGALGSVDRPYGIFDWFHHKLGSTHVVHHLFGEIPWYHADEATIHLRKKLGPLHNYDSRPWYKVLFHTARNCQFISDSLEGVQYYKNIWEIKKHD